MQQEEAFLAGLLADVGILVMHRVLGIEYDALVMQAGGDQDLLISLCRKNFDLDHAAVGGDVGGALGLAAGVGEADRVSSRPGGEGSAIEAAGGSGVYGNDHGGGVLCDRSGAAIVRARQELTERFKMSAEDIEKLLADIGASTREVAKLFELNIGQNRSYQEILDDAQQTLIQMSLQSQQQVQTITKENETLQVKATTDPLTGLANRARFNEFIEEQFTRAFKLQRPLAVLFIDIDHFKRVNDTHGHQAGDEVLRRVGKVLKGAVRNIDLAARMVARNLQSFSRKRKRIRRRRSRSRFGGTSRRKRSSLRRRRCR